MKRSQNVRNKYKVKSFFQTFLGTYKLFLIIGSICLLIGIITGIFTAAGYSGSLLLTSITDKSLVGFLKSTSSNGFSLFFPYLLNFILLGSLIIFVNFKPFLQIISYMVIIFNGYALGFNVTILIILYGFAGILNSIIIIIPFDLVLNLILIVCAAIAIKKNLIIKKYGCVYEKKYFFINTKKAYIFLLVFGIVLILLKCLCMPIIKMTIVVK